MNAIGPSLKERIGVGGRVEYEKCGACATAPHCRLLILAGSRSISCSKRTRVGISLIEI